MTQEALQATRPEGNVGELSAVTPSDVMARFLQIHRYLSRYSRRVMQDFGISGRMLAALRYLDREGEATIGEMSEHLYVRSSSASEMVSKLKRMELVSRTRCPEDNRVVQVSLTEKGRRIVEEAPLAGFGLLRERFASLSHDELFSLSRALDRIAELLDLETGDGE